MGTQALSKLPVKEQKKIANSIDKKVKEICGKDIAKAAMKINKHDGSDPAALFAFGVFITSVLIAEEKIVLKDGGSHDNVSG